MQSTVKQISNLRQKITWLSNPLILEMLHDARRGMNTADMIHMYSNQLKHLESEHASKQGVIQRDLEDQIREELENQ